MLLVFVGNMQVGGMYVVYNDECVVVVVCMEGVQLQSVALSMQMGRCRALLHWAFGPRRGRSVALAPHMEYGLLAANGALTSPDTLTCS
jgi:hypothetical protein